MDRNITSPLIRSLYVLNDRDEQVFELSDHPGIQVVRAYGDRSKELVDKRMFIKFALLQEKGKWVIVGGVDMVKNKSSEEDGWLVVTERKGFLQKPSSFFLTKSDDIYFNPETNNIIFENENYSVTEFINLLEKNHLRDMFLKSRILNFFRTMLLHNLFFLSDSRFDLFDYLFENKERVFSMEARGKVEVPPPQDPLFHYFDIYKNLFGFSVLFFLLPLCFLSARWEDNYFSATNPFLLFLLIFILYLLDKLSIFLRFLLKTDFVKRIARASIELKGKIKHA